MATAKQTRGSATKQEKKDLYPYLTAPDHAERFTFLVFGRYEHGKNKGKVDRKSFVTIELLGEHKIELDHKGKVVADTPPFVDAIRRLRAMCNGDGGEVVFQLLKKEVETANV